jgi:glycosyltransferase involved in cell wall biosynthesis
MPGDSRAIVFINHWASKLGGAELSLLDIISSVSVNNRVCLITSERGLLTAKAAGYGVQCITVDCSLKPHGNNRNNMLKLLILGWRDCLSFFRYVYKVRTILKSINPDVVHANVPKSHVTLFILALLGYRGMCIFHVREIFARKSIPYFFYWLMFPAKNGRAISISNAVMSNLPGRIARRSKVIYNGIYVPDESYINGRRTGSTTRFLYMGRIVPWKGCTDLVKIFSSFVEKYPDRNVTLSLIGDTTYWNVKYRQSILDLIVQCSLEEKCCLLPYTSDPFEVFTDYDVFCSASCEEPFGRSVAEAQAAYMPAVVYSGGAMAEIVEHGKTGFIVQYGNKDDFVNAMNELCTIPYLISEMGKKGHERACVKFNRSVQIPLIEKVILDGSTG